MRSITAKHIGHYLHGVYILVTLLIAAPSYADSSSIRRAPANFVPDDDLIEVPIVFEKGILDDLHHENKNEFVTAKKTVEFWQTEAELAYAYGLEDRGIYQTPSIEHRQNFMQRNYLRFVTKRIENTSNQGLSNAWERWTTDDEIDSIKNYEEHEGYIIKAKENIGAAATKHDKTSEVKVGKQEFKIDFQPRLEMGMVKIQMRSSLFNLKAWVGVNGNQEVQLFRNFSSTDTSVMGRYYIDQGRLLAALDQRITDNWSLRLSHDKYLEEAEIYNELEYTETNILQVRFNISF